MKFFRSAGIGEFLSDAHATEISIPDVAQTVDADFALRIAGDSMEPNYHDGDILLVRRTESVTPGELGIFVNRRTNVSQPTGAESESELPDGSAYLYYITFSVGYTGCFQIFYGDPVSGGATGS